MRINRIDIMNESQRLMDFPKMNASRACTLDATLPKKVHSLIWSIYGKP